MVVDPLGETCLGKAAVGDCENRRDDLLICSVQVVAVDR